nr:MAG TPA_asm: hypothetical protein [Bacteriophage sp.]
MICYQCYWLLLVLNILVTTKNVDTIRFKANCY